MRYFLSYLVITLFIISCRPAPENFPINGTWKPISQNLGGTPLPLAANSNQKLVVTDSLYTMHAESIDKGIIHFDEHKMDIYGQEGPNKGKHFKAIYKQTSDSLTVCYNLQGDSYPKAFSTEGQPLYYLVVFKRIE
ncbi:TIGR03067 domain-containing protein [Roseivirga thermotolerans]|uniref:TIGR03067 domain-containing protein n=1 Tax=Roseivirga thermotolerans TaxID=1758176 RepID=UPI00273D5E26|nr:TIGR03067 domain-containing protein [Roseivirga thermotolerans]